MNTSDQRMLKAVLGGLGAIAGAFARVPAIALPVAFESVVISATSILLDTFGEQETPVSPAPIKVEKPHEPSIVIKLPIGSDVKIEN